MDASSETPKKEYRPPETSTEQLIAGFWEELLDVEKVGLEDEFVDLGGNSLIATMLRHRVERSLGYRPTITEIFSSSLAELARCCDEGVAAQAQPVGAGS